MAAFWALVGTAWEPPPSSSITIIRPVVVTTVLVLPKWVKVDSSLILE